MAELDVYERGLLFIELCVSHRDKPLKIRMRLAQKEKQLAIDECKRSVQEVNGLDKETNGLL